MKPTQEEIANRLNVTARTIRNWEKDKPELLRLVRLAIGKENSNIEFWRLLEKNKSFFLLHDFFIDFYLKFLNFFRKNITMFDQDYNDKSTDIKAVLVIYLMQNDKKKLFDSKFNITDDDIENMKRDEFINLMFLECNLELSEYILRNTLDDFETLVQNSYRKDKNFFEAMRISLLYIVYKYEEDLGYSDKILIYNTLLDKVGLKNISEDYNKKDLLEMYIQIKDEFTIQYIELLDTEPYYKYNTFYVPSMVKRLKTKK